MRKWYAAHIIIYVEFKDGNQNKFPLFENVFLIEAKTEDEAQAKAIVLGKEEEGDCDGTFEYEGRPASHVFGGIRKIIECFDSEEGIRDGTEITYSMLEVPDKKSLEKLIKGDEVMVLYEE